MQGDHQQRPDPALEAMAAAGDRAAFAELYNRHSDRVYDFVLRTVRDREAAADITQETFLRAMRALKPGEKKAAFRTWVFRIARNTALDYLRKPRSLSLDIPAKAGESEQTNLQAVDPSRLANPEDAADAQDLAGLVWDAAQFLNPKESSILDLHLRQGLESSEIADVLGISKGNASTILSRLKSTLEESIVALVMMRNARRGCPELDNLLRMERGSFIAMSVRRLITRHLKSCAVCQEARSELLSPAALFGAFALIPMPVATKTNIGTFLDAQWQIAGPAATVAAAAGAGVLSRLLVALTSVPKRVAQLVGDQLRNVTTSWPYQTALWKGTHVLLGLVVTGAVVGGSVGVATTAGGSGGGPPAVLGEAAGPRATRTPASIGTSAGETDEDADGLSSQRGDCDDSDPDVRPGQLDVPNNGIDENCDGRDASTAELDSDGDATPDSEDACPDEPEDYDGALDTDGCPEGEEFVVAFTPTPGSSATRTPAGGAVGTEPPRSPTPTRAASATPTATLAPTATPTPTPTPTPTLSLSVGTGSAPSGGTVTIPVTLSAPPPGVEALTVEIRYTRSVAVAVECAGLAAICNYDYGQDRAVRVSAVSIGGFTGTVQLAVITFTAVGAAGSSTSLDIDVKELTGPDDSDLRGQVQVSGGRIDVQ